MKKGFTLLELLIVVVIIGVLALIAAPTLLNAADQAKEAAVKANVSAAASSVTSRFALQGSESALTVASTVAGNLNDDGNVNPIAGSGDAFATSGTAAGTVVLAGVNADDEITITGYGKTGGADDVLVTKVIAAPSDKLKN